MKTLRPATISLIVLLSRPVFCQLEASPIAIDFGSRGHNENPTGTLVLSNTGSVPITIREIKPSCGCIQIEPKSLTAPIPPGGAVELKVSMGSGRAIGVLEKHIEITAAEAGVPPLSIPVGMRVLDGFAVKPSDIRFDGVVGGQPLTQTVDIGWSPGVKSPKPFKVTDAVVKGWLSSARPQLQDTGVHFEAKIIEHGDWTRIEVTLKPTHPEGRIAANLEARIDGKLLVVPVVGQMFRSIKIVPTEFNFSRISSDDPTSFTKESVLTSVDGHPFKVLSMTPKLKTGGADIRLEVTEKGAPAGGTGLEHVLTGRISGSANGGDGSFFGTVLVKTDHPEKPEITLNFFGFFAEPKRQTKP